MKKENRKTDASITVFLSLILLIIMALLGTMVEVTRGKICRVYGRRVLKNAVDSLMTEYSRPLYERYHLFFIEDGGKSFEKSIAEYAAGTLGGGKSFTDSLDLYDGVLNEVLVKNKRYIGEDGGAALQEQITAYMKRSVAADTIQDFLGKTSGLESLSESAEEIDNKVKEEKEAAEENQNVLALMRLIDGVDCSGGTVDGQQYFVKMFHHGKKQPERFGITEPVVWDAVKGNIVELQVYFGRLQKDAVMRKQFVKMVREVSKKTKEAEKLAEGMKTPLVKMNVRGDVSAVLAGNQEILQRTMELLTGEVTDETMSELKQLWKRYNTSGIQFDYTGIGEKGGAENPMDSFSKAVSGGLTKLVCKEENKISGKSVDNPNHYQKLYADTLKQGQSVSDQLQSFAEDEEVHLRDGVSGIGKGAVTEFLVGQYMKKNFSSAVQSVGEGKKRLEYEWEYILCGGKSDKENLEEVIGRLMLIRSVINTTAILSSSEKRNTAHAAALAVVGFTGMEPLIRFTQTLFLVLWGMAESLVDVAALLQGRSVPLIKHAKDIVLQFPDLYRINNHFIMEKAKRWTEGTTHSFGYKEYLLLMMGAAREEHYYRMMDLMEWSIQDNDYAGFRLGICVDAFQVTGSFSFGTKFFRMPIMESVLKRKLHEFYQRICVNAGYTALP